jgi:histidinol-phosphate aminotransferase
MMFDCDMDSLKVYQGLLQHGIIVRPLHAYGINNFLRVTIGTPQQNQRFLESLQQVRQKHMANED